MERLLSCEFNMDTACVELKFVDGSMISVSKDTIRLWIKSGKIPFYKAGRMYKFKISEVDEWLRNGRMQE